METYLWVGDFIAIGCSVAGVYLLIYGIFRIRGRFMYSPAELLYLWFFRWSSRNKAQLSDRKGEIVKNRGWNIVVGISAILSSPLMILMAYLFHRLFR